MRIITLFLLLAIYPAVAFASLNNATVWEVRGNGSDTNGGGFALGVSTNSSKTDLAVDASNALQVTSAGYGFTSADIGRWIQVTAGTGWTLGYYQINAVSSGKATLNLSPAAVSTTAGSFTIYWGLDYTQQNAANVNGGSNGSSVLAVANGSTTITCSDCNFTHDIIGSVAYFSGGTGSIAAQRRAISGWTNSTTITIDTSIAASTGMTINIGGALASLTELLGSRGISTSNVAWWKNDTTLSSSTAVSSSVSTISVIGYKTTRGDLDSSIGSANRPKLSFTGTASTALSFTGGPVFLRNIIVDDSSGSGTNGISVTGTDDVLYNLTVKNYDSIGITLGSDSACFECEVTGGTVNALEGIKGNSNHSFIIGSYVHDGNGIGIQFSSQGTAQNNIVANMAGATSDCYQITAPNNSAPVLQSNTAYNCGRNGINFTTSIATKPIIVDNLLVNNAGFGIAFPTANANSPFYDGNAFYNNTSGTRSNMNFLSQSTGTSPYVTVNDVILTGNPFVSAGTGNFALNATAGAGGAVRNGGIPRAWPGASTTGYPDMGAAFHQDPGTVTVNANCGF